MLLKLSCAFRYSQIGFGNKYKAPQIYTYVRTALFIITLQILLFLRRLEENVFMRIKMYAPIKQVSVKTMKQIFSGRR